MQKQSLWDGNQRDGAEQEDRHNGNTNTIRIVRWCELIIRFLNAINCSTRFIWKADIFLNHAYVLDYSKVTLERYAFNRTIFEQRNELHTKYNDRWIYVEQMEKSAKIDQHMKSNSYYLYIYMHDRNHVSVSRKYIGDCKF